MGVNPFADVIDDEDPLSEEHCDGEEKWFPFGPSCNIHGKNVLCFVCSTENGSITSELLGNMLRHIDNCCVFDRTGGVLPFLLLDGHGSRFELPFLEYINGVGEEGHKWRVCIGISYGTSFWQVGDSAKQNGSFKMAMVRAKMKLLQKRLIVIWNLQWKKQMLSC